MNARLVFMAAMTTLSVPTPLDHTLAPAKHPTQEMEKHVSIQSQAQLENNRVAPSLLVPGMR